MDMDANMDKQKRARPPYPPPRQRISVFESPRPSPMPMHSPLRPRLSPFPPSTPNATTPTLLRSFAREAGPQANWRAPYPVASDRGQGYGAVDRRHALQSLGKLGISVIYGGGVLSLGILGFLLYLWLSQGDLWRLIVLNNSLAPTVTLCATFLRLILTAQAVVSTSLIAAILLERYGVPLWAAAEISVTRSVNSGPFMLSALMLGSNWFLRTARIPIFLVVTLMTLILASQFISTLLVSDLRGTLLNGNANTLALAADVDFQTSDPIVGFNVLEMLPTFVPFGELAGPAASVTPTDAGLSDTGVVQRVFLPLTETDRAAVRVYQGKGYVFSSRFVCARPVFTNATLVPLSIGDNQDVSLVPVLVGNISFPDTIYNAGLDFNCDGRLMLLNAASFTCYMGYYDDSASTISYVPPASMACLLDHTNSESYDSARPNVSGDMQQQPIQDYSEAMLIFQSNITYSHLANNLQALGNVSLPADPVVDGEFSRYEFDGTHLSISLCFATLGMDLADVRLSTERDLPAPVVKRNTTLGANLNASTYAISPNKFTTSEVLPLFSIGNESGTAVNSMARGTYRVEVATNLSQTILSGTMARLTAQFGLETLDEPGLTLLISSSSSGSADIAIHPQVGAVFDDVLARTGGRAALALQTMMTTAASTNLDNSLSLMNLPFNTTLVTSVSVLTPVTWRGFMVVSVLLLLSLLCTNVITGLFLAWTRHSLRGQYWHTIAQVLSDEETRSILDQSTEERDDAVVAMIRNAGDKKVRIRRTPPAEKGFGDGRVQLRDMMTV